MFYHYGQILEEIFLVSKMIKAVSCLLPMPSIVTDLKVAYIQSSDLHKANKSTSQ
jgi:hypothetical protein